MQLVHTAQRRRDHLAVQHGQRNALLDRLGHGPLGRLGVAALERAGVGLQRALGERRRVGPLVRASVRSRAFEHLEKGVEQDRVEVAAALFAQDLQRLLDGERLAVHAVARESVEDVGDRDDPPLDRYRLAGQAAGIA